MIDLRLGNVLDVLAQMPSESVHCIVTSPPYWGLRSYQTVPQIWRNGSEPCDVHQWGEAITTDSKNLAWSTPTEQHKKRAGTQYGGGETNTCTRCGAWRGELGLEPTPELFVEHIVAVMREARRVLRADGTLWLNIGDSYAAGSNNKPNTGILKTQAHHQDGMVRNITRNVPPGLKPKDLVGIPWRVAFALQQDGWYLRSDIIWHKPNPMPESVRDRPTKAHEYLFLLSKQPRYYYDADAVREPHADTEYTRERYKYKPSVGHKIDANKDNNHSGTDFAKNFGNPAGRNRRSVWTVTTHPYSGAHFATFPPKLIEPCILAATSERGCCPKCGAPWVRETKTTKKYIVSEGGSHADGTYRVKYSDEPHDVNFKTQRGEGDGFSMNKTRWHNQVETTGWRASCACDAGEPVPATVLDPFNGAGTTGLVALQHGRRYIGIDLKAEYLQMTRERLDKAQIALAVA